MCLEALGKEGRERAAFLDEACRGDPGLRQEVESLLAGQSDAESLLETPAWVEVTAPLIRGARLGPYEILSSLGAGGMGQVYRARDTRLDRTVAIKVLPPALAEQPQRRARFEQEAKAIGAMAHPHICTLYDVGELRPPGSDHATLYLVMEHLAGETLASRLERGSLPLSQALAVAAEVADALSAAHRQGVVHRDLKPGNVMLTKSGAKLLDFGLATLNGHTDPDGRIVGTLRYMSPEQLEGKPADARSDIWALGVLLYEMVAGRRAFDGDSTTEVVSRILAADAPALSGLAPQAPVALERLVAQCLAKAPDDRPDTAHDVAGELGRIAQAHPGPPRDALGPRPRRVPGALRRVALWALIFAAGVLAAAAFLRPRTAPPVVVRSEIEVAPADALDPAGVSAASLPTPGGSRTALAWTPDGRTLVFVGRSGRVRQLYVRRMDADQARPLAHTEDAQAPAVSRDGLFIAFWARGAICTMPLDGGPVTEVVPAVPVPPNAISWGDDGNLFFGADGRLWTVPPGAKPMRVPMAAVVGELGQTLPFPLPGGRVLLYTARTGWSSWSEDEVVALDLRTGKRTQLLTGAADARYLPTGHLVFLRRGVLHAVPFDPDGLELRGQEVAVLDHVAQALTGGNPDDVTLAGQYAVSATGTLAWVVASPASDQGRLVSVDLKGATTPLPAPAKSYGLSLRVSPDGRRLAVTARAGVETGLWVGDVALGSLAPLTAGGDASWPVWTRDGGHLVFSLARRGKPSLAVQSADGSAPPLEFAPLATPSSFARDGRLAAVVWRTGPGWGEAPDIALVTIAEGKAKETPLVSGPYKERWPEFSPDGRWLLFGSDVSGRDEIYVQPYPGPGGPVPVTSGGGSSPAWHPNGKEIFFLGPAGPAGNRRMMVSPFAGGSPPRAGEARPLFEFSPNELAMACDFSARCYDVAPDGTHFYAIQRTPPTNPQPITHINILQNWFAQLKAKQQRTR